MKLRYRPMAIMGFSSISVLFICAYFDDRFSFVSVCAGILILLLTIFIRKFRERVTPFFIAAALIFSGISFEVLTDYKISYSDTLTDKEAVIEATVLDEPEFKNSKYYYILKTEKINGESFNVKLRLSAPQYIFAEPYDRIKLKAKIYELGSFSNDIKLYYHSKGIFLGGYLNNFDDDSAVEVTETEKKPLEFYFLKFRKAIESRIIDKLPNDNGAVTVGMLTGNKEFITDEMTENIRSAGVAPVFAVSGMHLSVWIMGLYSLLETVGIRKRLNSIIGIASTVFFMAVTGFTPSVCRAGIMLLTVLSGNLFRKKADPINSLGFSVLILGIINPMIVADIGFLLSFSSTFGIITFNPWFKTHIEPKLNGGIIKSALKYITEFVFISVSATFASLGFLIAFIGYISVYSVLSNLLITYAASLCMICGGITAFTALIGGVGDAFALITVGLSSYILKVIDIVSDWKYATVNTSNEYWAYGVIVFYAVVALSYIVFKNRTAFRTSCVGFALTVAVCVLLYNFNYSGYTFFKVVNADDSVAVIVTQDGKSALICSNSSNKYLSSSVLSALNYTGCDNLDIMIADTDNESSSGVLSLMNDGEPKRVVVPKSDSSMNSILPSERLTEASNARIVLWKDTEVNFVSNSHYSIAYCTAQNVRVCIILRADDFERIPKNFLDGDVLVASKFYDGNFEDTVITGDSEGEGMISSAVYGNIDIKIKDNDYKFVIEED